MFLHVYPCVDSPGLAQLTVPVRLPPSAAGAVDSVSYVLTIEGRLFTIHLQQQALLSDDFRLYVSEQEGPLHPDAVQIKGDCHYQGFIEGFPSSAVTLSTCSGLRGLLQFDNISYGIEPLAYSAGFKHFVYPVSAQDTAGTLLASSPRDREAVGVEVEEMASQAPGDKEPLPGAAQSPKTLRVSVVVDKALYSYMGANTNTAAQKIIQAFNLINSMFQPLNVIILLSSLEVWTQENKISTALEATELQTSFTKWKRLHRAHQEKDLSLLLLYKARRAMMGATMQGAVCERDGAGAVAVYQSFMTLESFSVLVTQLLAHSLGMRYDDARSCQCRTTTCIMDRMALFTGGTKAFSNCSSKDFETFLKQERSSCLFHTGRWRRPSLGTAKCGNGEVEPGEQCDCGAGEACSKDKCCTRSCRFKPGVKCSSGPCCSDCQFRQQNSPCRPAADPECDLPEVCSGSSASCPPDLYLQDGHICAGGTGYCYKGRCQSPELQCQKLYGRESRNAPMACYEELNSQKDRFGHCGFHPRRGYQSCAWRDLRCGKLVCTYPSNLPYPSEAAAVAYARVRHHLCISLHYLNVSAQRDPLLVPPGTKCGSGKLCINSTCQPLAALGQDCASAVQCHGHGVCNNRGQCHCQPGWQPPNCQRRDSRLRGSGGSQEAAGGFLLLQKLKDTKVISALLGTFLFLAIAITFGLYRCCRQKPPGTEG
ncbi:disintegrin and metalloproteinase domain-containing protein 32-like [Dryobates pubescens]|uniref:disintegrin and metalloproteinase domain-containing protein 32-like n=1 Tax=Dryobates pubescens TaxID=118200 RepID=UPI0023B8D0C9|nr:disintegrin and metalloproteinase domain-containing protein 32-like [Dryobates pubescens]